MTRTQQAQAGFTLLELMVTVAIIGVLAAIAVPTFASTSRKTKGDSEVNAFFAELRIRQEQYQLEYGRYMSTGADEAAIFPTPSAKGTTMGTLPATWTALKVRTPESKARCGYVVIAGTPTDNPGPIATGQFGYVKPSKNWFYVLARCDMDGSSTLDGYYFVSSDNATIQKLNAGR
jgi:prepilin-type N-terminal cleavage/methylation domain-containing protein